MANYLIGVAKFDIRCRFLPVIAEAEVHRGL